MGGGSDPVMYTIRLHDAGKGGYWAEVEELPGLTVYDESWVGVLDDLPAAIGFHCAQKGGQ